MAEHESAAAAQGLQALSLTPTLTVNDLQRSLRFYTDGLGFAIEDQTEVEGQVRFVVLRAGASRLGLAQDDFAKGRDRVKGVGMRIWVDTGQDITALAERAKVAGITLDNGPSPLPWGPMGFAVTDPDGFKLTIANEA
ncbi:MAG: VOC family protein [Gemmatimonadetes bacterium]|nr:VOC family protein [Gemmatimonadota bacterium]